MFSRTQRSSAGASASIALAGALASAALASSPMKGATYAGEGKGPLGTDVGIEFKVSASGASVSDFDIGHGFARGVGDEPCVTVPFVTSGGSATIAKDGSFRVSLTMTATQTKSSQHVGTMVVTGKFAADGKASGKLEEQFDGQGSEFAKSCDASVQYAAKTEK